MRQFRLKTLSRPPRAGVLAERWAAFQKAVTVFFCIKTTPQLSYIHLSCMITGGP
jgi:hypothetical protein